jgi:hypothetical protein
LEGVGEGKEMAYNLLEKSLETVAEGEVLQQADLQLA